MNIVEQMDQALEDAMRARHALPEIVRTMRDAMKGQPGAASFDSIVVNGGRSVMWCWDHEREVAACHRDDMACTGESILVNDIAGEAATDSDEARSDHHQTVKDIAALARITDRLVVRFAKYQSRAATDKERKETERANEPGCELHARVDDYRPPKVESSTVKNTLDRPYRLCSTCYQFVIDFGRVPTETELRANVEGRSWKRPIGNRESAA